MSATALPRPPAAPVASRALLDAALDAVVVIDAAGLVLEWNLAAERVLGFAREEALGRRLGDLVVPPELRQAHHDGMRRYLRTGEARVLGRRVEIVAQRKDGSLIPVELAITRVPDVDQPVFTGFLRDISDRKRAERAERVLAHVGDMFAAPLDSRERARWTAQLVVADLAEACVVVLAEGMGRWSVERGEAGRCPDLRSAADQALATARPSRRDESGTATIAVPLIAGRRVIGAVAMCVPVASPAVHAADLRLAQDLALRCALAIDRARSYEQRSRETRVLQQSVVPSELPLVPGLGVAGHFRAAGDLSRIGGDFYDVFALDDGRWAAVIGDVGGKGPQAAAGALKVRHSLRAICGGFALPSQALARLNELLVAGGEDELCSVALGFVAPGDEGAELVLSLAGHPPPLLETAGGEVREVGVYGQLLGAFPEGTWHDDRRRLVAGERVVLFTDGLLEQRRDGRHVAVPDELSRTVAALRATPAPRLAEQLVAWAVGLQDGEAADDTAVLVLEAAPLA